MCSANCTVVLFRASRFNFNSNSNSISISISISGAFRLVLSILHCVIVVLIVYSIGVWVCGLDTIRYTHTQIQRQTHTQRHKTRKDSVRSQVIGRARERERKREENDSADELLYKKRERERKK